MYAFISIDLVSIVIEVGFHLEQSIGEWLWD